MRILRYEVPVDGEWHEVRCGNIVHVASRSPDVVEVWASAVSDFWESERMLRVYGTGHAIEVGAVHVGTALAADGRLVWHLLEKR